MKEPSIHISDARVFHIPGEGWSLLVVWKRADGKGRVIEEIISIGGPDGR